MSQPLLFRGIPVITNVLLCQPGTRQRRVHRRSRINRKWKKRYGFVAAPCQGHAYACAPTAMGKSTSQHVSSIAACPCYVRKLKQMSYLVNGLVT